MSAQQPPTNPSEALQGLRERLRRRPDDGQAWLALARLLAAGAPGPELFHSIEQAIRSLPESEETWSLAAAVQERMRGPQAAWQWLEQTASQNPGLVAPQLALAQLAASRSPDAGEERYRRIITAFPGDPRAKRALQELLLRRGDAHREGGRWQPALAAYREVEPDRADDAVLMNNIGCCLMGLENPDEAEGYFERALLLEPGFVQARLNTGLLHAYRGDTKTALAQIEAVQNEDGVASEIRASARTLTDIMREQLRLAPVILGSLETGTVDGLQAALDETPATLLKPDPSFVEKLGWLAEQCGKLPETGRLSGPPACGPALALIEALAQCKVRWQAGELADWARRLTSTDRPFAPGSKERAIRSAWRACLDRQAHDAAVLQGTAGEAWLRYWHARLLEGSTGTQPGQFKAVVNALRDMALTPPENVVGTVRVMFGELRSKIPSGIGGAIFSYMALMKIHGFSDGNGRLARFILNWEARSAGLPAFVISLDMRKPIARSEDLAWFHGDFGPLLDDLSAIAEQTQELWEQAGDLPVSPDFLPNTPV